MEAEAAITQPFEMRCFDHGIASPWNGVASMLIGPEKKQIRTARRFGDSSP
jgi:hypothetical protein